MGKLGGSGLVIAGIVLAFLGFVLRTGLIKWLIDVTGLILIILGIVLLVIGVIQMFSGRGRESILIPDRCRGRAFPYSEYGAHFLTIEQNNTNQEGDRWVLCHGCRLW